ncbi:MAG TPA: hypothetical protein VGE78_08225, partial [Agromyces sp.]
VAACELDELTVADRFHEPILPHATGSAPALGLLGVRRSAARAHWEPFGTPRSHMPLVAYRRP